MTLDIFREKGTPLEQQVSSWRDLVQPPYSKLDDDAFTRVRAIFMNGIESEAIRFSHACARMNGRLQPLLAEVRRAEQQQQTAVNWLHPADQDPLETTLGFEQVAIEVTASVAQNEPDPYLKEVYDFGLLEDFDHLYRYSALYDRLYGRDPNALLQSYTDIVPGRPTSVEHRHPLDDLRRPYDRARAAPLTKIHAMAIMGAEHQTHDYYMTIGPMFSDPLARQLYAEIASVEEQHVTQYESIIDPTETWLEKWLLHEATEVWAYWSCAATETSAVARGIYERFLSYELGHLHVVMDLMRTLEGRDPAELLPSSLPTPISFESHRGYVRDALLRGVELRADGPHLVPAQLEPLRTIERRDALNAGGSPSEIVAAGYQYTTGGELSVLPPATVRDLAPAVALERVLEQPLPPRTQPLRAKPRAAARTLRKKPQAEKASTEKRSAQGKGNRTGAEAAERVGDSVLLLAFAAETPPSSAADGNEIGAVRRGYAAMAEPIGHVAPIDERPERSAEHLAFLDKLGERLAFERSGARLYEALLVKLDGPPPGSATLTPAQRETVALICLEEHEHYLLLQKAIQEVGGDPSCLTPSADVAGVLTSGLSKVVLDPRTTVAHALEALLIAELADNDAWERLEEMAVVRGLEGMASQFAEALESERDHLEILRSLCRTT